MGHLPSTIDRISTMRVDLAKLLTATFQEKHISEMIVNTLDITKFKMPQDVCQKEQYLALGDIQINIASEDTVKFNELVNYCFVEQMLVLEELTQQADINLNEPINHLIAYEQYAAFQKKYTCP